MGWGTPLFIYFMAISGILSMLIGWVSRPWSLFFTAYMFWGKTAWDMGRGLTMATITQLLKNKKHFTCHAERSEASAIRHANLRTDPSFLRMTSISTNRGF